MVQVVFRLAGILGGCYACGMRADRFILMILMILFAWATRLYHLDSQSIWFDEGWSAYAAVQPTLLAAADADPTNPPLYYMLLNLTTRGFGDSPFGLRVTSTFFGLLTVPLAFQLGRRLLGRQAGLYAAFLVGVSPLLWWASQEARMYTLLAVLVLIAALAWHQLLARPDRRAWAALLLAETLLLYAHNTGPVIALWLNTVTLIVWLRRRRVDKPDWRLWVGGQLIVALAWLPWFLSRFVNVQAANSAIASGPEIGPELLSRIWQAFWTAPWEMVGREPLGVGFAVFAVLIAVTLLPWRHVHGHWLIGHTALLICGLLLGLTYIGNELHGRYLVMAAPLLLVALGAGIARLRWPVLRYGIVGVFVLGLLTNILSAQNPLYQHDDARGMVKYYADTLTEADTVLAWSYADRYELVYYWDRLNVAARRVTLPEGADQDAVEPLLPESGRVALNIWYTQRADYRAMLPCLLGHGSASLPTEFTTYGMSNRLYESLPQNLPETQGLEQPILHNGQAIVQVVAAGSLLEMTTERALCVPVELHISQALNADLRAALIVRNAIGWDIAQESGIFATANQRTTSALMPGELAMAYVLLRLPYGAPPGDYEILLRVFDDLTAPSGYDMGDAAGHVTGKELSLGTWRVQPGADWAQVNRQTGLPQQVNQPVNADLTLKAHNLPEEMTVQPGQDMRLELLWEGAGTLPDLILRTSDAGWEQVIAPQPGPRDTITLDWRTLRIPAEVGGGTASLSLPDGTILTQIQIDALPRLDEVPDFATAVNERLGETGTLIGYTPDETAAGRDAPFPVTLVWRAGNEPSDTSYTVFVQLLNSSGQLIAQSDSIPAQGQRPTTGWRAGEYILDRHALGFNDLAAPGEARLIVGMYDALTGERVPVDAGGRDYIELPGSITVR